MAQLDNTLKEMDKVDIFNLERLAYILRRLSAADLETLEILLDDESSETISQSLQELDNDQRISIDEW